MFSPYGLKERAFTFLFLTFSLIARSQPAELNAYNVVWNSQSANSGESMPCGGGDIGLNVWVENGDLLFYVGRSGTFDENNTLLKLGRVRLTLSPNPFKGGTFRQELNLKEGNVIVTGSKGERKTTIKLWVDVFRPVVHAEVSSNRPVSVTAGYESWRYADHITKGKENNENSWKWAPQGEVKTRKDEIRFVRRGVLFFHHNTDTTVFDAVVRQQGMEAVKAQMYNPLHNLTFGGLLAGSHMNPSGNYKGEYAGTEYRGWRLSSSLTSKKHELCLFLSTAQTAGAVDWEKKLDAFIKEASARRKDAWKRTVAWWKQYWQRSFVFIKPSSDASSQEWQAGRNYQLFRYMLGCNARSEWPTKFNGGLFTYDPSFTDSTLRFTPDFRNWGGGTHTAQNQRLVYWPLLKSGDTDLMQAQFRFYLRILKNAELRSKVYWGHNGACFSEQLENFGLPNPAEYSWKRPPGFDKGMEYNAWLEYEWDTVLEFCMMMLEEQRYTGRDNKSYLPFIKSCLTFFNEHYQYLARQRGNKLYDAEGHLVFYPGSGGETYKMAYNSASTVSALRTVLRRLIDLPAEYLNEEDRKDFSAFLDRIPPLPFREFGGHPTIAPAKLWERINNVESTQLYPVFPWGIYGIGKPGLDTAINTYRYDPDALKFRSHIGWKQDNIFAARLGLASEAAKLTVLKLKDSGRRFPAFWGPGYDWAPDHNWGGSGMIGLQEMLMQCDGKSIYLFPSWPAAWDVHFRLNAPYNTVVEATVVAGKLSSLKVTPESRKVDVKVLPLQ